LDGLFNGAIARGSIVEWIGCPGVGATTLALLVARAACQKQAALVVVDHNRMFYPPAAQALGISLDQAIVVQPCNKQDYQWSLIQILRCAGVAAVVCWPERANERMLRRAQIAAERGGTLGLLVRPPRAIREPSWARYRLLVEACCSPEPSRRWKVTLIRSHTQPQKVIELEINHETGNLQQACPVSLASSMASSTALQGAS
jgi:hypothetical protein